MYCIFSRQREIPFTMPISAKCYYIGHTKIYDYRTVIESAEKKLSEKELTTFKKKLKLRDTYLKVAGNEINVKNLTERLSIGDSLAREEFKAARKGKGIYSWDEVLLLLEKKRTDLMIDSLNEVREAEFTPENLLNKVEESLRLCVENVFNAFQKGVTAKEIIGKLEVVVAEKKQESTVAPQEPAKEVKVSLKDAKGMWDYTLVMEFLKGRGILFRPAKEIIEVFPEYQFNTSVIGRARKMFENPHFTKSDLFGTSSKRVFNSPELAKQYPDKQVFIDKQIEDLKFNV